ncbi:MAG: hypothetical protein H7210_12020 [Pyrinomonadaceae bacterium]|nr:hypothetical protein [Phycisphaerales bacterium]
MTTPHAPGPDPAQGDIRDARPPSAMARRLRFGLQSFVLLLSVTASFVFIGLIGTRFPYRFDATASREHRLSERTQAMLAKLEGSYEIVVAASRSSIDRRSYQRTRDVLDTFDRSSDKVRVTFIDTGSSRGIGEYDALLKRLAEQYAGEIDAQRKAGEAALNTAKAQQPLVAKLAADLAAIKDVIPRGDAKADQLRTLLDDYAARARVASFNLEQGIDAATKLLAQRVGPLSVPPIDDAIRKVSQTIAGATGDLARLVRELKLVDQAADVPGIIRDRIKPLPLAAQAQVDAMRMAADVIDRLPKLTILSVARTLEQTSAALVIGPPSTSELRPAAPTGTAADLALPPGRITAIDFTSLFPPALPEGATPGVSLDMRARTEELTVTALASLSSAQSPIIVLMHDQPTRLGPEFRPFAALIRRLHMHGIDTVEWPVAISPDEPSLATINPGGKRPVVYVSQTTSPATPDAAERMKRMATALARIVSQGRPILFSVNVSTIPSIGDTDPLVEFLPALGIAADSGRPLLTRVQTPGGPVVLADFFPRQTVGNHPIAKALNGLSTHFFWPVSIRPAASKDAAADSSRPADPVTQSQTLSPAFVPVIQIPADNATWAESEWLSYARLPASQRLQVIDPPAPDSPRDDAKGPWPIVVAAELPILHDAVNTQRLVVVGCSGWFLDDVTQQSIGVIDGRPVLSSPGNLELFEASIYWLARQEDLIAQSPQALAVPVIRTMTPGQVQAVRWSLFAGLPLLVLLIGALWRLARG